MRLNSIAVDGSKDALFLSLFSSMERMSAFFTRELRLASSCVIISVRKLAIFAVQFPDLRMCCRRIYQQIIPFEKQFAKFLV